MGNPKLGLCAIVIALFGAFLVQATPINNLQNLGTSRCTWGPTYWCSNITNAKGCNAVRHCIQTVWEHQEVPTDNDGICKICKDMVTQARDQLRSNETMDEMRQVFEGSCRLIPIKVITKECIKLSDDFIPELVEALTSQMNPDQVCTVAGLCNNARIDELLTHTYKSVLEGNFPDESQEEVTTEVVVNPQKPLLTCGNCNQLATVIERKFHGMSRDDLLENMLRICGEMSSLSDSCAAIALNYFNEVYDHLNSNLNAAGICHMSGSCVARYHQHPDDVKEEAPIDLSKVEGDDIPCELCEQLVKHLRDVLIANTTESEFKQVLQGLCNQTKGFKDECLSLVDQYYAVIYNTLVNNLDANGACFMIGICPASENSPKFQGDIRPLLPVLPPAQIEVSIRRKHLLGANEPKFTQDELINMQLPIDRLMGPPNSMLLVNNGESCTLCEYILHFIQETLATPATEDEIKHVVNTVCDKMGQSLKGQCHNFVDMYGDPIIALLIQGLNPREICPKLKLCPDNEKDAEVFLPFPISSEESDKPTCPLCIFAVDEAKAKIKDDKTKKNIQNVLDHLCNHLPTKMQPECIDFVQTYSKELLDMLIADFSSKEICVDLNLCPANDDYLRRLGIEPYQSSSEEIFVEKEETPKDLNLEVNNKPTPDCLLCEELLKLVEKRIGKHPTKESIKKKLDESCSKLRPQIKDKCHKFVEKYGDEIADILMKETDPKIVCREMGYCWWSEQEDLEMDEVLKYDVIAIPEDKTDLDNDVLKEPPTCVLCEFVMAKLETELQNKTTQDEIKHTIEGICKIMPKTVTKSCNKFIEQYANTIIALIGTMPPKEVCKSMQLCASPAEIVITDDVIECGVCHGASLTLLPYLKQHLDLSSVSLTDMVSVGCENLPAKYFEICSDMIGIYGKSFVHLSEQEFIDEAQVCSEIGKCFDHEKSGLAFARISV